MDVPKKRERKKSCNRRNYPPSHLFSEQEMMSDEVDKEERNYP